MQETTKSKKKVKIFNKKKKQGNPEQAVIQKLQAKYTENIDIDAIKSFADFPLSSKTLKGLKECGFTKPTEIQKATLMLALAGKDILGAAQTGSGKTLAFVIPILEKLFCKQWTNLDGLGALVITPTRELAYQIFETLRKVGLHHDFSAGLVIGGKDLKFERNRMDQCNIIICTPGRLLQHMDENPLFDAVTLQILVLDEADRCLDMGFEETMNAIIANLPLSRQTMLFSATQTKSVKDLARLSLKDPSYISVHENAKHSTPPGLQQSYVVCELHDKVSILWSFIKNHLKQKTIVFMSSCKQVKYIFEIFSKLRPGVSLMALYGTLHQLRRMDIYESFTRKTSAVLFATDIAARGLDFPEVHWVVQMDCPEDSATYIHRVGRTARYHKGGESLLMLLPSELQMLEELETRKIPIEKIDINPERLNNPVRKIEAYLASNSALNDSCRRAFIAYVKSVALMKNKKVFNANILDTDSFAHSLGLSNPPRIRFLQRMNAKKNESTTQNNKTYFEDDNENLSQNKDEIDASPGEESYYSDDLEINQNIDDDSKNKFSLDVDSDDDCLITKRKNHDVQIPADIDFSKTSFKSKNTLTKAAMVKKVIKKNIIPNQRITFNETGEAITVHGIKEKGSELAKEYENEETGGIDIEKAKLMLKEEDKYDRQIFKERVKAKHRKEKEKLKEQKRKELEIDDFGDDESVEEGPDLSWVPDPEKVYGKQDDLENSNDNEKPVATQKKLKRKKKEKKDDEDEDKSRKKKRKVEKMKKLSSNLNIDEAEELALMLLKK